jgi:hypothetical protein
VTLKLVVIAYMDGMIPCPSRAVPICKMSFGKPFISARDLVNGVAVDLAESLSKTLEAAAIVDGVTVHKCDLDGLGEVAAPAPAAQEGER